MPGILADRQLTVTDENNYLCLCLVYDTIRTNSRGNDYNGNNDNYNDSGNIATSGDVCCPWCSSVDCLACYQGIAWLNPGESKGEFTCTSPGDSNSSPPVHLCRYPGNEDLGDLLWRQIDIIERVDENRKKKGILEKIKKFFTKIRNKKAKTATTSLTSSLPEVIFDKQQTGTIDEISKDSGYQFKPKQDYTSGDKIDKS